MDNLPVLLGQDAADAVLMILSHQPDPTMFPTNVPEHIRAGEVDLKWALARTCDTPMEQRQAAALPETLPQE